MKIALVHDYLAQDGGAERVVLALHEMFPDAPLYTLFYDPAFAAKRFPNLRIIPSFLQKFPFIQTYFQWALPLMPLATESYHFEEDYDLIISSTSAFAKGIIPPVNVPHISYIHTPTRFLWSDTKKYVEELRIPRFIKSLLPPVLHSLRTWDALAATRPNVLIANSKTVQDRIQTYYHRDSTVIYPPVDTHLALPPQTGQYFITGGRLVYYKHCDVVVEACTRLGLPLVVYGDGPQRTYLETIAGPTVKFVGKISDTEKWELLSRAIAFVNPQLEDFGITAVESMAAGKPVVALRAGGATETVIEGLSGVFFNEQTWEALAEVLTNLSHTQFDAAAIQAHAQTYTVQAFKRAIRTLIETYEPRI